MFFMLIVAMLLFLKEYRNDTKIRRSRRLFGATTGARPLVESATMAVAVWRVHIQTTIIWADEKEVQCQSTWCLLCNISRSFFSSSSLAVMIWWHHHHQHPWAKYVVATGHVLTPPHPPIHSLVSSCPWTGRTMNWKRIQMKGNPFSQLLVSRIAWWWTMEEGIAVI